MMERTEVFDLNNCLHVGLRERMMSLTLCGLICSENIHVCIHKRARTHTHTQLELRKKDREIKI